MACRLSNLFRQLYINSRGVSTSSSQINNHTSPVAVSIIENLTNKNSSLSLNEFDLKFSPRAIDFGLIIQSPPPFSSEIPKINIIDTPLSINRHIIEPIGGRIIDNNNDDIISEKSIDLPTHGEVMEKLAHRMIVIRRKKIKKHKRKKFLKRSKYLRLKIRSRKKAKNEKQLKIEVKYMIKSAESFSAIKYVEGRLEKFNREIVPTTYRGEILPEATIRQFLAADKEKREKKKHRRRLTLD